MIRNGVVRTVFAGFTAVTICSVLLASCAGGQNPVQAEPHSSPFSLVGLDGHEATRAVAQYLSERSNLDCVHDWEAAFDVTGLDQNLPEASGLADGSEPTPEILNAIREAGSEPDLFEHWYVTSTRAVFASFEIEEGWSAVPQVIQVLWLGFDAEGEPQWGADYGAMIAPC